jgi:hypothetical protein
MNDTYPQLLVKGEPITSSGTRLETGGETTVFFQV